jgi:hypothetical protein
MHDVFTVVQGQDQQGAQGIFSANREFHGPDNTISTDLINNSQATDEKGCVAGGTPNPAHRIGAVMIRQTAKKTPH